MFSSFYYASRIMKILSDRCGISTYRLHFQLTKREKREEYYYQGNSQIPTDFYIKNEKCKTEAIRKN